MCLRGFTRQGRIVGTEHAPPTGPLSITIAGRDDPAVSDPAAGRRRDTRNPALEAP